MLVVNLILAGMCVFLALQIEPISRRLEALPYYAKTYINKLRPRPELPPPPAVSEVDPQQLLQISAEGTAPTQAETDSASSDSYLQDTLQTSELANQQSAVKLVESTTQEVVSPASEITLTGIQHEWQTWNNCGPVTIAMNLSYYGQTGTQVESAQFLKPNQDDKNVNPEELAAYARSLGFETSIGVGGDLPLLKQLLSNHLPVIVETWAEPDDLGGMGHYRLLTGYNETENHFVAYDSLNGANIKLPTAELDQFWQVFNRKYLLVYRPDQSALVHAILGPRAGQPFMYQQALRTAQTEAQARPDNPFAWFNIGTNYFHLGQPKLAASAFDQARRLGLPFRMLWYQFEIFETYLAMERYQEVIELATATLEATGGLEEIYYYRGLAWQATNQPQAAIQDWQAALDYNPNFAPAAQALEELTASHLNYYDDWAFSFFRNSTKLWSVSFRPVSPQASSRVRV